MENITLLIEQTLYNIYDDQDRVTNADLKETISKIYKKLGYQKTPYATDVKLYGFATKRCKIVTLDEKGKPIRRDGQILTKLY